MKKIALVTLACTLLILFVVQPAAAAPSTCGTVVHYVRWGETLGGIARRYGTTVSAIMHSNYIRNRNRIYAGQRLVITCGTGYHQYPYGDYRYGDYWYGDYRYGDYRYGDYRYGGNVHIVRYGETLGGIAYRYGISVNSLVQANGIVNRNRIYSGQRLIIPYGRYGTYDGYGSYSGYGSYGSYGRYGRYYIVRRGDTLSRIAYRYGVSSWAIASANNLANPNVIYTGQRLFIP
jgi:LysM repeat protein